MIEGRVIIRSIAGVPIDPPRSFDLVTLARDRFELLDVVRALGVELCELTEREAAELRVEDLGFDLTE